jgi:hypothetical protein
MGLVTGVHRNDNMMVKPLAQKTSKWKHAEIKRGNGKLACQRSEYAQGSARIKSDARSPLRQQVCGQRCVDGRIREVLGSGDPFLLR